MNKSCSTCGEMRPIAEFSLHPQHKDGRSCECKFCKREYDKRYYQENKGKFRNARYVSRYGLTLKDYNEMFEKQAGCCFICGRHQREFNHLLDVDHDHTTGAVRALLCSSCNNVLRCIENTDVDLIKFTEYLRVFKAEEVS